MEAEGEVAMVVRGARAGWERFDRYVEWLVNCGIERSEFTYLHECEMKRLLLFGKLE